MYQRRLKLTSMVALLTVSACGEGEASPGTPPGLGDGASEAPPADSGWLEGPDGSGSAGPGNLDAIPGEPDARAAMQGDAGLDPCASGSCIPHFGEDGHAPRVTCGDVGTATINLAAGTIQTGPTVGSYENSAKLCGKVEKAGATRYLSVAKEQIAFAPKEFMADLIIPMPAQIVPLSDAWGTLVEGSAGHELSLTITGEVHAQVFGFPCVVGPFKFVLTTGKSGGLTGKPLTAAEAGALGGTLVDNVFEVPWTKPTEECVLVQAITDANLQAGNLIRESTFATFEAKISLH